MTKFRKQIISAISAGAIVLNMVSPVLAADTILITGNGASSDNTATVQTGSNTTVVQSNNAFVTNTVTTSSTTGFNDANKNTNGDVMVKSGDATTKVTVDNILNSNDATVACCENENVNVTIAGNGYDSDNDVTVSDKESATSVFQNNLAEVKNTVNTDADTGKNDANKNTNGDVYVKSGDALTQVGVSTTANSNSAVVGWGGPSTGGVSAVIADNGADSDNDLVLDLGKQTSVYQGNSARVWNEVKADADTGHNDANKNTGGEVWLETGDAAILTAVSNNLNYNAAVVDCCNVGEVMAKIVGNGADSDNTIGLRLGGDTYVVQGGYMLPHMTDGFNFIGSPMGFGGNQAQVENHVYADASTGKNDANKNTGGAVGIFTGDADVLVGIDNTLNFNYADIGCCSTGLLAKIDANGADTVNDIVATLGGNNGTWQGNSALLGNIADPKGDTGYNDANKNTGGPAGYDPMVITGDAGNVVSVSNRGNMNEVGGPMPMPQFEFNFQFMGSWMQLIWNMVHV